MLDLNLISLIASIATIVAMPLVVIQLMMQSKAIKLQTRPYVHVVLDSVVKNNRKLISLKVRNTGSIPAHNLEILFQTSVKWKALAGNPTLPFESSQVELTVWPGEEIQYVLGPAVSLPDLAKSPVTIQMRYSASVGKKPIVETFNLSLDRTSYMAR